MGGAKPFPDSGKTKLKVRESTGNRFIPHSSHSRSVQKQTKTDKMFYDFCVSFSASTSWYSRKVPNSALFKCYVRNISYMIQGKKG